ncbi:methyltransferase [Pseudenhygromyxa sp. WMMC2535]|uniref:methyltransferase n=1 Tax=Pseudenhygromyxa sp. WMMC2535 TaxID=2712867 RepID=UPI001595A078|nr:methyltransferase [Pseudenhygromyxa sp. WMMC2535]NVB43627.1 methyltransferase [Pseudenhygromyxa sp. WMMC2535]
MQIEAAQLRMADVVLVPGVGEQEVRRLEAGTDRVRAWFRGDEAQDAPSQTWPPSEVLTIKRPGDMFEAPALPRPKTVHEANRRIIARLRAIGWESHQGGRYTYVSDPTDSVRLQLREQVVHHQGRIRNHRGSWTWNPNTASMGFTKDYAMQLDREVPSLAREAEEAARARHASDQALIDAQREQLGPPSSTADMSTQVVVRYSRIAGVILCGETYPHRAKIREIRVPYRLKPSRRLPKGCAWYVPRTRDTFQPRERVEQLVEALRLRGVPAVLDYDHEPEADALKTVPALAPAPKTPTASRARAKTKATKPKPRGRTPDASKRAAKLRAVADKAAAAARRELDTDRLENTHRRAEQAASVRQRARGELAIAEILRRAADEVEAGELEHVSRISNKTQVKALDLELRRAGWERARSEGRPSSSVTKPAAEDIAFATLRPLRASNYAVDDLLKATEGLSGVSGDRARVRALHKKMRDDKAELDAEDVEAVRALLKAAKKHERKVFLPSEMLADDLRSRDRLAKLSVTDTVSLKAALREYLGCCAVAPKGEDPKHARGRKLLNINISGFVPTPEDLAKRVVDAAEIEAGMRVLEPSAGAGALASEIRARHPDATLHLIELSPTLRDMLCEDGFEVIARDFCAHVPERPYDRIVMNPPFERQQDVEHIERALGMLAPVGAS